MDKQLLIAINTKPTIMRQKLHAYTKILITKIDIMYFIIRSLQGFWKKRIAFN